MATAVIMPRQGQSVETCIITEWYKKKGDPVKKGDLLFGYETDKASFEEEAKEDGILIDVFFEAGDEAPVLVNVAVIGTPGEDSSSFRPGGSQPKAETPVEQAAAPAIAEKPAPTGSEPAKKARVSPRARNMAKEMGIALEQILGSGPNGRIIARDIEAQTKNPGKTSEPSRDTVHWTTQPTVTQPSTSTIVPATHPAGEFEDNKLSNIRKIIAKSMHESLQNSAQLTHHMSADARKLLAFREKVKQAKDSVENITLNDMICYCVIRALKKMPEANSHFLGDQIRTFKKVHLGLAVDTPRGLMVPALKYADDLSIAGLSSRLKALADNCKKGSIDPELLSSQAATFTVSNLGNYGVEMFTPVINLPQVAILGVNTIISRPVDLGHGAFGFVPYLGLSLTYDHRALDGGPATLFLREIKQEIEGFNATL